MQPCRHEEPGTLIQFIEDAFIADPLGRSVRLADDYQLRLLGNCRQVRDACAKDGDVRGILRSDRPTRTLAWQITHNQYFALVHRNVLS